LLRRQDPTIFKFLPDKLLYIFSCNPSGGAIHACATFRRVELENGSENSVASKLFCSRIGL